MTSTQSSTARKVARRPAAPGLAKREPWDTLRLLRTARSFLLITILLLMAAGLGTLGYARSAFHETEQALDIITSTQQIESALAGMEADAAEELLVAPSDASPVRQDYDVHRVDALTALTQAAEQASSAGAEQLPLQAVSVGMSTYEELIQRARDLHGFGMPGAVSTYGEAAALMRKSLRPSADLLDQANSQNLEVVEHRARTRSLAGRLAIVVLTCFCTCLFVAIQIFLSQRTHRTFNLPLLAATLLVFLAGAFSVGRVASSAAALGVLSDADVTGVRAPLRASATAYNAQSEKARSALDPEHVSDYERAYVQAVHAVAQEPQGVSSEQLLDAARNQSEIAGFSGLLAEQLGGLRCPGEKDAVLRALVEWTAYVQGEGDTTGAGRAGVGRRRVFGRGALEGTGGRHLQQFEAAEADALRLRQQGVRDQTAEERQGIRGLLWNVFGLYGLSAALVALGFAPRIREYR